MFLRLSSASPTEPDYPKTLDALGLTVTNSGQVVDKLGGFFNFFRTDNELVNRVTKELAHAAVRTEMNGRLARSGISKTYLSGTDGDTITTHKPDHAHVALYTSKMRSLKRAKDVIIVCGEAHQNGGVWAWRDVMREAGIEKGSVVQLASSVQAYGQMAFKEDMTTGQIIKEDDITPGLIILNPGERLYSPLLQETLTEEGWASREKPTALSPAYTVHKENIVSGHGDAQQHVDTFFERILPELVGNHARLYLIGVASGTQLMLNSLDGCYLLDPHCPLSKQVEAFALVAPTHSPDHIKSNKLRDSLNVRGRSWISSAKHEKGALVSVPDTLPATVYSPTSDTQPSSNPPSIRHGSLIGKPEMTMRSNAPSLTTTPSSSRSVSLTSPLDAMPNIEDLLVCEDDSKCHDSSPEAEVESGKDVAESNLTFDDDAASVISVGLKDEPKDILVPGEDVEAGDDAHDYDADPVSCPTYSAGWVDVAECIYPVVHEDVFHWFTAIMDKSRAFDGSDEGFDED